MTDKVDKPLMESISALIDGEAGELELRRVLKSGEEPELRELWQRYQLARSLMRGDCHSPVEAISASSFSAGVMSAIEAEDSGQSLSFDGDSSYEGQHSSGNVAAVSASSQWFGGLGKVAIAASVAFAMILGTSQFSFSPDQSMSTGTELTAVEHPEMLPGDTSAAVPEGYSIPSLSAMTVSSVPGASSSVRSPVRSLILPVTNTQIHAGEVNAEIQEQLQHMLFLHSEKAANEVGITIVPGARLSSQDLPGD